MNRRQIHRSLYLRLLQISGIILLIPGAVIAQQSPYTAKQTPFSYTVQRKATVTHGAVVSAHPLATGAGVAILQKGGNAIDAAIATQLALAVVYPAAGNIGGGGFMIAHLVKKPGATRTGTSAPAVPAGLDIALDFRERAPAAATRDMYLDPSGNPVQGLSENGHLASGVPGTIAGIFAELKYAKLPFAQLIQPAIDLAEKGFAITESEARSLNGTRNAFKKYNTVQPVFLKAGDWKAGDTLIQKDLAKTLRLIRDKGAKGFYEGETARLIVEEMQRGKGIITAVDLENYKAVLRTPTVFPYHGHTIVTMPLPSSGGVVLQQMLKMVEDQPLASYGFESVKTVHLMTEVERLAYADRAQYLGDRDYYSVPVDTLVSTAYLQRRLAEIPATKAGKSSVIKAGVLSPASEETTHLDVVDAQGNAVSITTTLNGGYGNRVVVGGAGFFLNNEMDDFSIKPGVPNMYGAVGTEANAIVPGKRMLSSMSPTIVLDNGKVSLVVGTPGGTTITTSVFQTLVDILDFHLSAEDAVNRPKFHHQWLPDDIYVEPGFPIAVQDSLKVMGYLVAQRGSIGRTEVIQVTPDHKVIAVGDRRGDDTAMGY
ncbi:MAG TPA: gamma-glutamyltransferase [Puia sp.]|jgi:gamma-glutamyltranspeptidase/glutathione hydrolase|nr:gamma-glutamyltransferase [Puia sp.]